MTALNDLRERVEKAGGLRERLATCHPSLARGRVWCLSCGATQAVDAATCFRTGWPTCCGATMTIDSPKERAALSARAPGEDEGGR